MGAEAPQRVLVGAQLAEVQAVAVDVVDLSPSSPRVRQLLELRARPGGTRAGGRPSAPARPARPPRPRARRRPPTAPAASRRSSACRPRAPGRRGRRASGPASRARRVELGIVEQLLEVAATARPRELRGATLARALGRRRSTRRARSRGSRRSCARGSGPSSRARRRRSDAGVVTRSAASQSRPHREPTSAKRGRRRARRRARRRRAPGARPAAARSSAPSARLGVEVDEHVPAVLDRLDPLGAGPQRDARHAGQVGLLLQPAGVGQHGARRCTAARSARRSRAAA